MNGANGVIGSAEDAAEAICREPMSVNVLLGGLQRLNRENINALDMSDETFEQFVMMVRNKRKHGFYHMMDYARKAWGTKWNAYDQDYCINTPTKVTFQTAWSHPAPVFVALSKKFPDAEIKVSFADEDLGCNCGNYIIKNGEMLEQDIAPKYRDMTDEDKRKWREFAFKLLHPEDDPKDWDYDENWDYVGE